jgi:hypothetical protein
MQTISEEVKKFILAEENEAIESTGIPITFSKLVKLAAKYERQTGKTPEYHATFEQQIDQVPRGRSKRKEFIQEVVQEILANPLITKSDRIPNDRSQASSTGIFSKSRSPSPGAKRSYPMTQSRDSRRTNSQTVTSNILKRPSSQTRKKSDNEYDEDYEIFTQPSPEKKSIRQNRSPTPDPRSSGRGSSQSRPYRDSSRNRNYRSNSYSRNRSNSRDKYSRGRSTSRGRYNKDRSNSRRRNSSQIRNRGKRIDTFRTLEGLNITINTQALESSNQKN